MTVNFKGARELSGAFNIPKHKRKPTINITSLIDVMFLLLIFFMVSSTFKDEQAIEISLPQAESSVQQDVTSHEILVDREGGIYFEQTGVEEDELRETLRGLLAADPGVALVLRADKEADFGRVIRVIDIARELNAANLVIPTDLPEASPEVP